MKNQTKFLTRIAATLLLVTVMTSCEKKAATSEETVVEPTFNLATAKAEIETANKEFTGFIAASDSIALSNLYTSDAKFMMTGAPAIVGKESIQATFSGMFKSGVSNVELTTLEVWGTEDVLTEEGEFLLFAGETKIDHGKYMVIWKKEDGKWKLHRDMISSSAAPAE